MMFDLDCRLGFISELTVFDLELDDFLLNFLICFSVPLTVEPAKPVTDPFFQDASPPTFSEVVI